MITTAYAFYPPHPLAHPHYDPEFLYQSTMSHGGDQFTSREPPAQTEVLHHDTLSWWPPPPPAPTDDGMSFDSYGHPMEAAATANTTMPEAQQLPSTCYPYQDEIRYRRESTVSTGELDSGESIQSATTTTTTFTATAGGGAAPPRRPALRRQSSLSSTTTSSSSRPHECGHCTRTFARRHDLERHTRVHTGIKPYVCPCCLKAFPRSDARGRHFRNEVACRAGPQVLAWMKKNVRSTI